MTEDILSQIHQKLSEDILKRATAGDLTAADITAISKFLKDNNYSALPEHNATVAKIGEALLKRSQKDDEDEGPIPFPISK